MPLVSKKCEKTLNEKVDVLWLGLRKANIYFLWVNLSLASNTSYLSIVSLAISFLRKYTQVIQCFSIFGIMISIIIAFLLLILVASYVFYFIPKIKIRRMKIILQSLGYKVYEEPVAIFGASILSSMERNKRLHNDAQYFQKTVLPHVDISLGNTFHYLVITFVNPELMKDFLKAQTVSKYEKFEPPITVTKAFIGKGLIFSEGQSWKNKRKLLSQAFTFELLKENIPKIVEICDTCLVNFEKQNGLSQGKIKYDIQSLVTQMFNKVLMRCFFGCDEVNRKVNGKCFEDALIQLVTRAAALSLSPFMISFGKVAYKFGLTKEVREVKKDITTFRSILVEIMKKRVSEIDGQAAPARFTDLTQAIIYEKLKNKEAFSYSDADLIDQFSTFLAVGTDTTAKLVTMMVYYIAKDPRVHKKLREEIDQVIKSNEDITSDNLRKLTYIDCIQNETLRHFGPVNGIFPRLAQQDNLVKDVPILKGTLVMIQQRGNNYNSEHFENPEEFNPQRWEKENERLHPYAFLGFSAGPRSCIGKQLALLQSKIALIKIIKRYEHFQVPQQLSFSFKLVYEPDAFDITFTTTAQKKE